HRAVGWAKAVALPFSTAKSLVRRAHAFLQQQLQPATRGHGVRESERCRTAVPAPLLCPPYEPSYRANQFKIHLPNTRTARAGCAPPGCGPDRTAGST